jgi:hypothetical protein
VVRGCFYVQIFKSKTAKLGEAVKLRFSISQNRRDIALMQSLIKFLDCGNVTEISGRTAVDFNVIKFIDLTGKVLPLLQKYPLQGVKLLDYLNFVKVIGLMKNKAHLTEEGLEQIRAIKSSMNRGQKVSPKRS